MTGVYAIRNRNGHQYIGSSVEVENRWKAHLRDLRRGTHHSGHLQNAYNKYGESAFAFVVLEVVANPEDLVVREQFYLDTHHPEYNICIIAGSILGIRLSEETRRKMSDAQRGRIISTEHRRKLSEAQRGKYHSTETRRKMSETHRGKRNHFYGRHHSEEIRKKISEAGKGRFVSEETRRKMSESHKGISPSEETRRKISEATRGRVFSEATRRKMSEASKKAWARRRQLREKAGTFQVV